jgi:carbonic anhydrase
LPPDRWSDAFPDAAGTQQSPIELYRESATPDPNLGDIVPAYRDDGRLLESLQGFFFENLHFEIEIDPHKDAGGIRLGQEVHKLVKFHFHTPAEHPIDGQQASMEVHIVHASPVQGSKGTVVGLMVREGARDNPIIAFFANQLDRVIFAGLPEVPEALDSSTSAPPHSLRDGFPALRSYFHYVGSLTTPPCTEGIDFYILDQPIEARRETIEKFAKYVPGGNNRPTQPPNGRRVGYYSPGGGASA